MQKSYDFVHHVLDPLVVGEVDHVLWNAKITVWGEVVRVPRQGGKLGWPYDPDSHGHRCTMHIHLPPLLRAILDLETPFSVRDPTFAVDLAEKASGNLSVSRENAKCVIDLVRKKPMPELVRAQMPTAAAAAVAAACPAAPAPAPPAAWSNTSIAPSWSRKRMKSGTLSP